MNLDMNIEEVKRRRVILERKMVARTRRAYEFLLPAAKSHKDNREVGVHFLKWHLIAYINYLEAIEVDEIRMKSDGYAGYIRAMLTNPWILTELPPLPFWTPSTVPSKTVDH